MIQFTTKNLVISPPRCPGAQFMVVHPRNGVVLAYADTAPEAEAAKVTLESSWPGLTRGQAITAARTAEAQLLENLGRIPANLTAGVRAGVRRTLIALADAGAFCDGKNMADRLDHAGMGATPVNL